MDFYKEREKMKKKSCHEQNQRSMDHLRHLRKKKCQDESNDAAEQRFRPPKLVAHVA